MTGQHILDTSRRRNRLANTNTNSPRARTTCPERLRCLFDPHRFTSTVGARDDKLNTRRGVIARDAPGNAIAARTTHGLASSPHAVAVQAAV